MHRFDNKARKFIFAADTQDNMRIWMNIMSLGSIAFGSGAASRAHGWLWTVECEDIAD